MQHLQSNTTLQSGKYRIERVLGQGGFGITYLAYQPSLQREVAIKEFFMKDYCSRDDDSRTMTAPSINRGGFVEKYRKKFIKEARNLARLNHPYIISVIDVFEENDTVYYVMPYLSKGSLQDYVEKHGALSEQEAMKYVKQIAQALKYMHEEQHICHYDVKPANILVDDKDNAVLIDFGISKNYDAQGQETTTTPVGVSEGYAPIEQYQQNLEEFSPESDVYALGATLYFLLHGKRPINAPSRAAGIILHVKKSLSSHIVDIINASMKVSKVERVRSMDVFLKNKEQPDNGNNDDNHLGRWLLFGLVAFIILYLFFVIGSSNFGSKPENGVSMDSDSIVVEEYAIDDHETRNQTRSPSSIQTNTVTKTEESDLVRLIANNVGKYPYEVGLSDNKEFSRRFSSLIGNSKYLSFKANNILETPIKKYDNSGRYGVEFFDKDEQYVYYIVYDKSKDNMTVIMMENGADVSTFSYVQEKTDQYLIDTFNEDVFNN